jgi:hypothetical protein
MATIRDRLIGAWSLVSFESRLPDGRVSSPLGRGAQGHIVYSANGIVSVNLSRGDRVAPGAGRLYQLRNDDEIAAVARGYMAYSGRFEVDEARAVARHHFELCIDPALIGTLQERHIRFFDDRLELSVLDASEVNGIGSPSALVWQRVQGA